MLNLSLDRWIRFGHYFKLIQTLHGQSELWACSLKVAPSFSYPTSLLGSISFPQIFPPASASRFSLRFNIFPWIQKARSRAQSFGQGLLSIFLRQSNQNGQRYSVKSKWTVESEQKRGVSKHLTKWSQRIRHRKLFDLEFLRIHKPFAKSLDKQVV